MTEQELILSECTTLFHMLKKHVKAVREENALLHSEVERLKGQLAQKQNEYNMLKMAKMVEITDSDLTNARNKVNKLIREVNKCINLLSEK